LSRNFQTSCAYWQNGSWESNNSTQFIRRTGEIFVFQANHLTDFALIMVVTVHVQLTKNEIGYSRAPTLRNEYFANTP